MTELPLISIVMPSFNQAAYLEQAICSVLEQDYPRLELLVVDGGSTDGSAAIIQKYAHRLAWWVSEKDQGQADGINKGLARAQGEIVAWLNSDDMYLPGTLREAASALQANPQAGMVFGDVQSIDADGAVFNLMRYGAWGLDELMRFHIIGQPGVFMRRSVQLEAGGLDERFHLLLDHHLWLRMAARAPVVYVPHTWAAARYHAEAKNVAQAGGFGHEAYRLVEWMRCEPDLRGRYLQNRRKIWAGAHRINGFYLLEGRQYAASFAAYARGLWQYPPLIAPELHRMAYAAASLLLPLDGLRAWYLRRRREKLIKA